MDRLTRVVVRGRKPTFMNAHSGFTYMKKFDVIDTHSDSECSS